MRNNFSIDYAAPNPDWLEPIISFRWLKTNFKTISYHQMLGNKQTTVCPSRSYLGFNVVILT